MRKSVKGRTKLVTAKGSLKTRSQRSKEEGGFRKFLEQVE